MRLATVDLLDHGVCSEHAKRILDVGQQMQLIFLNGPHISVSIHANPAECGGKRQRTVMAAAKIRFNSKSGGYEIENFGNHDIKAVNMRWSK